MEEALIDLKMAEERAKFFNYSAEEIGHIQLLERAVWRVRQQIIEKKLSAWGDRDHAPWKTETFVSRKDALGCCIGFRNGLLAIAPFWAVLMWVIFR